MKTKKKKWEQSSVSFGLQASLEVILKAVCYNNVVEVLMKSCGGSYICGKVGEVAKVNTCKINP